MKLFLSLLVLIGASLSEASPIPGANSSLLSRPQSGLFWRAQGFVLPTEGTSWMIEPTETSEKPEKEAQSILTSLAYNLKSRPAARFTVNVETLKTSATLEAYSKKWAKEYYQYGFDLVGSKPFKLNSAAGVVYDLKSRTRPIQLRQVIFVKNKTAVTLTCSDEIKHFNSSFPECDKLFHQFRWE